MNDRELLEAAARAAKLDVEFMAMSGANMMSGPHCGLWRPLEDDGDALRLAMALRLDIIHNDPQDSDAWVMVRDIYCVEDVDGESYRAAATRRAIVRAAAALAPTGEGDGS
jgi:hypothetical protein